MIWLQNSPWLMQPPLESMYLCVCARVCVCVCQAKMRPRGQGPGTNNTPPQDGIFKRIKPTPRWAEVLPGRRAEVPRMCRSLLTGRSPLQTGHRAGRRAKQTDRETDRQTDRHRQSQSRQTDRPDRKADGQWTDGRMAGRPPPSMHPSKFRRPPKCCRNVDITKCRRTCVFDVAGPVVVSFRYRHYACP